MKNEEEREKNEEGGLEEGWRNINSENFDDSLFFFILLAFLILP